jgi:hypothetical protein
MGIPPNIKHNHVIAALNEDKKIPKTQTYRRYVLIHNGKKYPPRSIISLANKYANGSPLELNSIGSLEAKTFLVNLGFEVDESSSYNPIKYKVQEVQNYLSKKYSIPIEKVKGFKAGLALPSGAIIHVSGSRQHPKTGGFYALTFKKYDDIISRQNAFYAILLENAEKMFVLPSNKVKDIFSQIDPGKDKEWHYHVNQQDGSYILKPNNDPRDISEIHHIETYLNKWNQVEDYKERYTSKDYEQNATVNKLELSWQSLTEHEIDEIVSTVLQPDNEKGNRLAIPREIVKRVIYHLISSKHVILLGPPGTGKTDLSRRLLHELGTRIIGIRDPIEAVASYEWGRYDVIG